MRQGGRSYLRCGMEAAKPTYFLSRWLFLRGLALVFAIAFASLWVQIDGLIGSRGILPIADLLDAVRQYAGGSRWAELPTLCWLGASDASLHLQCAAGVILSIALFAGLAPRPCLALLWALYLSLTVAGQEFFYFQWDVLLLETAVFAIPFAPGTWLPGLAREKPPSTASRWLLRWLLFRLMFASGMVKLTSGDPAWGWSDLTAITYHYGGQPLPTVFAWYASQLPTWFHRVSCAIMYAIEIGVPWLVFGSRRMGQIAFAGLVALQILIGLTGNYGFFNLLSIVLCLPLLDDALLARFLPRRLAERAQMQKVPRRAPFTLRLGGTALAWTVGIFSGIKLVENIRYPPLPASIPDSIATVERVIGPFRSLNNYGLFRVMTKTRREIEIQGSDDEVEWKSYLFRWKPGALDRAPAWVQPHMPRLDWQMWFAALGPARESTWFTPLVVRLLQGSPPVLGLLAGNPFPDRPPRFVRAIVYEVRFSSPAERAQSGDWWTRREAGTYIFPRSLR